MEGELGGGRGGTREKGPEGGYRPVGKWCFQRGSLGRGSRDGMGGGEGGRLRGGRLPGLV